jgi:hypothetical protein
MASQQPDSIHDVIERSFSVKEGSIHVMQRLGPIDAEADGERVLDEEFGHLFRKKRSIGLNAILEFNIAAVFSLEIYHLLEELQAVHQRLSAMPYELNQALAIDQLGYLCYRCFQHIIFHPWYLRFMIHVTIAASHVASISGLDDGGKRTPDPTEPLQVLGSYRSFLMDTSINLS